MIAPARDKCSRQTIFEDFFFKKELHQVAVWEKEERQV